MREPVSVGHSGGHEVHLPRLPGAARRFWVRHPRLLDVLIACGYFILSAFFAVVTPLSSGVWSPLTPILISLIFAVVGAAGLLLRRHMPWGTFAVFAVIAVVALVADAPADPIGVGLAVYALFVYRSNRSGWLAFATTVLAGVVVLPALDWLWRGTAESPFASVPGGLLFLVVMLIAALLGVTVGDRRRYIGAILDRANQLARERDQQARIATLAERARITREIHDVVAHSVSVMVSLADGAGALATKDPERSRSAIQEIGEVGRQSLVEMRQLLGALGDSDGSEEQGPLRPSPGLSELGQLVGTFRAAGLPVVVRIDGAAPPSPALQNTIHRIVQEALTNALRYARDPREVLVHLDFRGDPLVVDVSDDGRQGPPAVSVGSGRGLVGVRERARLAGGTAESGPRSEGGWRVRVTIPAQEEQ